MKLIYSLFAFLISLSLGIHSNLHAHTLDFKNISFPIPNAIQRKINEDGKVIFYKSIDLNSDKLQDVILVLESPHGNEKYGKSRKLLIFFQESKNIFKLVLKNNDIIACSKCSKFEPSPDPFRFRSIEVNKGEISIIQYFDIRFNTSLAIYNFKYDKNIKKFLTTKALHVIFKLNTDPDKPEDYYQDVSDYSKEFGKTLDTFNPKWHTLINILDDSYDN